MTYPSLCNSYAILIFDKVTYQQYPCNAIIDKGIIISGIVSRIFTERGV